MKGRKTAIALLLVFFVAAMTPLNSSAQVVPNGPWVDEIDFLAEPDDAKIVDMLKKGDIHVHLMDISDPDLFAQVKASPVLAYKIAYGLYLELSFNPVGPTFKGGVGFNPFYNAKVREAMNWLVDRNYIVNEIFKGLARPKLLPIVSAFPDYGKLAETAKLVEAKYAYNFEKAKEAIFKEMAAMGAEYKDGKWYYAGSLVTLKFLIRTEDQRKLIGDYVANSLEKLGFTIERMYKPSRDASPIWLRGDPAVGQWHIYTGGWITTIVSRDDSDNFGYFYTPLGRPEPLWQAYKPGPEFYEVATKLWKGDWSTWAERMALMRKASELALQESERVWLVDQISPFDMRQEVGVAVDLSGGLNNPIWARTVRYKDKVGGILKASNREVLVEPWNPVAGTNWVYDQVILRCVQDYDFIYNPYTGIPMPNRLESVTMEVEKGVPCFSSSPWLTLKTVDKVLVPSDAWFGWDVATKTITNPPSGTYAKAKVVVNYGDVIGKVKYHDGSVMSMADWFATWPLVFERADTASPLYDASAVSAFKAWRDNYRGEQIISTSPLVVAYYINYTFIEAEFMADWASGWPNMPWHAVGLGILAEEKGLLAFSASKAVEKKVEWANYIGGPSLVTFSAVLDEAKNTGYIPFRQHASKYITAQDASARYDNLKKWNTDRKHYYVASGPFYLATADFTAHIAVVKAFRDYTFKADRWAWLAEPPIPELSLKMPQNIVPGLEAPFTLNLTTKGQPYANDRIELVKYLVLDSAGNVLVVGDATAAAQGQWSIKLKDIETAKLTAGTYRLMAIALSKDVGTPGFLDAPFVVIPEISYFQSLLAKAESGLNAQLSALQSTLTSQVTTLQGTVSTLQTIAYASVALAAVAIVVAIYSTAARKKA